MIQGITITDIYDTNLEVKLKKINGQKHIARIVIDTIDNVADAIPVVQMVNNYCEPMIQIQDSFGEAQLTPQEFYDKAQAIFTAFPDCKYFELGNEINGDWCSQSSYDPDTGELIFPGIVDRVKSIWKMMPSTAKSVITLFYENDMVSWYRKNILKADYILFSYYPQNAIAMRMCQSEFNIATGIITSLNPNCFTGMGEFGWEEFQTPLSWRQKAVYRSNLSQLKIANRQWQVQDFYWDGQSEGF